MLKLGQRAPGPNPQKAPHLRVYPAGRGVLVVEDLLPSAQAEESITCPAHQHRAPLDEAGVGNSSWRVIRKSDIVPIQAGISSGDCWITPENCARKNGSEAGMDAGCTRVDKTAIHEKLVSVTIVRNDELVGVKSVCCVQRGNLN